MPQRPRPLAGAEPQPVKLAVGLLLDQAANTLTDE